MLRNNADARRCSYFELGLPVLCPEVSVVLHFPLSPPRLAFLARGDFSRALAFRSLNYPSENMGTTASLAENKE